MQRTDVAPTQPVPDERHQREISGYASQFITCALLFAVAMGAGCGPSLQQQSPEEERLRARVRKDALKVLAPATVTVKAGEHAEVTVAVRIAPGFYLPSRDEPDTSLLATWLEPPKRSFARLERMTYPHGSQVDLPARARALLAYDGTVKIKLRFALHRNVAATRYLLPFVLHYQLCTVRGCEVPERRVFRIAFSVQTADQRGNLNDLVTPQD